MSPTPLLSTGSLFPPGLIHEDDFNRADSDFPGAHWREQADSDADIVSNELKLGSTTASVTARVHDNIGVARAENFVQVTHEWDLSTVPAVTVLFNASGQYGLNIDDSNSLLKIARDSTVIASAAGTWSISTQYQTQFYVAAGVQEAWCTDDSGTVTASASDTTHDALPKLVRLARGFAILTTVFAYFDDFIWCTSKNITATGMTSGYKAKVRNSGASVVAQATESGGTATVDCSRFGSATEIVPIGGWTDIIITDASDVTQKTISGPIYPGQTHVGA